MRTFRGTMVRYSALPKYFSTSLATCPAKDSRRSYMVSTMPSIFKPGLKRLRISRMEVVRSASPSMA